MSLQAVAVEAREKVEAMKAEGFSNEKIRKTIVEGISTTTLMVVFKVLPMLENPVAGVQYTLSVNQALGAVNEVLLKEYDIAPIHISELNNPVVKTLEEFLGKDIDTILTELAERGIE
jgi:hypothetical protein